MSYNSLIFPNKTWRICTNMYTHALIYQDYFQSQSVIWNLGSDYVLMISVVQMVIFAPSNKVTKYPSKQSILYFCTTEKYKYFKMISLGIFYSMKFFISAFAHTWDFARVLDAFSTPTFFMHLSQRIHLIIENFRLSWLIFLSWFTVWC